MAALVGYPDQGYFSRVFKKATGSSPLEYRERGGPAGGGGPAQEPGEELEP